MRDERGNYHPNAEWCGQFQSRMREVLRHHGFPLPQPEGYTCDEALDSYPDPPPKNRCEFCGEQPLSPTEQHHIQQLLDEKSGLAKSNPRDSVMSASNSLAAVGQTESGVALDGSGAVLPPQRQEDNRTRSERLQAEIEQQLDEVQTDGERLAFDYLVAPDNTLHCREDYREMEWEELTTLDVARFAECSTLARMRAHMRQNAGLPPI